MRRLTNTVAVTLGFALLFLGGAKLNGLDQATAPLSAIGISPTLFDAIGWGEITIGVLLTQTALHRLSGVALALWMFGASTTHLLSTDLSGTSLPLTLTLGIFGLFVSRRALPSHPRTWWPAPLTPIPEGARGALPFVARHVAVSFLLRWAVGGLAFWASLPIVGLFHATSAGAAKARDRLEHVLLYVLFYGYGAGGIWNFTGHFFAADMVAASVGWPTGSPFQQELAFYALGTGTVGLLTPWLRDRYWIAAALAPSIFVYGAAYTHITDSLTTGNDAPMNWSFAAVGANLIIPTAVLALLLGYARAGGFTSRLSDEHA